MSGNEDAVRVDLALAAGLAEDLTEVAYTHAGVEALLGPMASQALLRDELAPARWVLERGDPDAPLATVVRLFLLGEWSLAQDLDRALPRTGSTGLAVLGLVELATTDAVVEAHAALDLRPYRQADQDRDWWVVSDLGEETTGTALDLEHVIGIGQAGLTLAGATVRRRTGHALDLGTGCGIQALHLHTHSGRVTATDLSARARRLAALTFALNGIDDVELLDGDLLEPVTGREFDLVVSNPPFVITPRSAKVPTYTYRDAGRVGDRLVQDLVRDLGQVLAPGGLAQMLGNWEIRTGEHWTDRIGRWLEQARSAAGEPLDAWVIQRDVLDPAQYAQLWARDGGVQSTRRHEAYVRAWLDDLAGRDVAGVGLGLIMLRRPGPGTQPLRRLEQVLSAAVSPLGAHLDACWQAHDGLPADDRDLLTTRLLLGQVSEHREHEPGAEHPHRIVLHQHDGFGRQAVVDPVLAAVLGACDGTLPLGALCGAVADLMQVPVAGVTAATTSAVRGLVVDGFLRPSTAEAAPTRRAPTGESSATAVKVSGPRGPRETR